MHTERRPNRYLLLLSTMLLLAAACGSSNDASGGSTPVATTEAPAATTTSTAAPTTTETPTTTTMEPPTTTTPAASESSASDLAPGQVSQPNVDEIQRFLSEGGDAPFYMVNLIKYRENAEYPDGRESDLTGAEADRIYADFMANEKLPEIGAEIMYSSLVEQDVAGASAFDVVAVVKYPSRAAFQQMTTDPEFQAMSIHKEAGVEETTVLATSLVDAPTPPPPDNPAFAPTADDQPFAFVHVFDYRDTAEYAPGDENADDTRAGSDAVNTYSANAGAIAGPLGVRPAAWFQVEATFIGPPGVWEEVRINTFPSHATFQELTSDPTWQSGTHHRKAGLEHTYAIMTAPRVNAFNGVVAEPN